MRRLSFLLICLFGGSLTAETIGNVEFQFPPSVHDWVLFLDSKQISEADFGPMHCKIYTHKVGDALEFFTTVVISGMEDEEDDEMESMELAQSLLNEMLTGYLPNHRFAILQLDYASKFIEWEMNDGVQSILHGVTRVIPGDGNQLILSYSTTMVKNAENTMLWTDVLQQATSM